MNQGTTLAILAHQAAQPTIDDFLPRWKVLPCRLVAFVPEGDAVQGFQTVYHIGESAHKGAKVFQRFLATCEALLLTDSAHFVIAEYDTVNLLGELPKYKQGYMISNFVEAGFHDSEEVQLCALSPWVMDRETLQGFTDAARGFIDADGDAPQIGGLLDRWIGLVVKRAGIPHLSPFDMIGYPWEHDIVRRIKNIRASWVHGLKRKEDFGDSWTG
jgi:hypothetical protein